MLDDSYAPMTFAHGSTRVQRAMTFRAASAITGATSAGIESMGACLVSDTAVCAPMGLAKLCWSLGTSMRRCGATMYHDGLDFHAASEIGWRRSALVVGRRWRFKHRRRSIVNRRL